MAYRAIYSRGQIKIQQMAFVLVAIVVLMAFVFLFYITVNSRNITNSAQVLYDEEAKEIAKKIASYPELVWSEDCKNCIDFDKALALKNTGLYKKFWELDYLEIEIIYPEKKGECNNSNYNDCKILSLIKNENFGSVIDSFVSVCSWDGQKGGYQKCELGKIKISVIDS